MKVLDITSISKEEGWIYYRNQYKATASLEILTRTVSIPLSFIVEINPLGMRSIEIEGIPSDLDYPVVPIRNALKKYIDDMAKQGKLP